MEKRPLSQTMRQWLLDELDLWQDRGLVKEDQVGAILDIYETPTQSSARKQSIAIYALIGIAAMFVALAVFMLVGFTWEFLPDPIKCIFLLAVIIAFHGLGFYLRYAWQAKIFSEFAFFFGSLMYGAAIGLIAHIFHLGDHPPDGIWWWAMGVAPLALFLDTVLLHMLATALLATWVGMEMIGWGHREFLLLGLPRAAYTLPLLAGMGLLWAYQKRSVITVGLYVPLLAWWIVLLPFAWRGEENPILVIGSAGALLLMLSELHPEGSKFAIPYRLYGSLLCMGVLSVLSFHDMHRDLGRIRDFSIFLGQSFAATAVSGGVFAVAFVLQTRRAEAAYTRPLYAFAVRQWLPLSMVVLMLFLALYYAATHEFMDQRGDWFVTLVPTILANFGMVGLAFWLMMYGLREDRGFPASGGVVFFLLWSIFRYAEWFGARGEVLGAACMFFLCGAAIFAFAMFWHVRKKQRERSEHERATE